MPARWQSSQRPLFVRTVWVNGRRHAVLSRDDPVLQYPRPTSTSTSETSSQASSCCHLEDCLIKLQLALQPESYQGTFQESIFPIRHGTVEASACYDHDDSDSVYGDVSQKRLPLLGQYPKVYSFDQSDQSPFLPELQLNPLSERVLQWLDLTGKGKRLNSAIGASKEIETSRAQKIPSTTEKRRTHSSRRELHTRSLSVDVLANMKLSARSMDTHAKQKKPQAVAVVTSTSSNHDESHVKSPIEDPPVIQNFEPPRLLRSVLAWPQPQTPNRRQLHIFMPPLEDEGKPGDSSECESNIEEVL